MSITHLKKSTPILLHIASTFLSQYSINPLNKQLVNNKVSLKATNDQNDLAKFNDKEYLTDKQSKMPIIKFKDNYATKPKLTNQQSTKHKSTKHKSTKHKSTKQQLTKRQLTKPKSTANTSNYFFYFLA